MTNNKKVVLALNEAFFSQFGPAKKYAKNKIILEPGEEPNGVFFLKSGYIRLYLVSKEGKELTLNIFKSGMFFPMIWTITEIPNVYFLETLTDVEILKAPRKEVLKFLEANYSILFDLTKRVLSGLDGMTKLMDVLLSKNAYYQVCAVILMLGKRFGEENKNGYLSVEIPLTHRLIGTLASLSREATSRELEKLTREKIIEHTEHKLIIKKLAKLEEKFTAFAPDNFIF